MSKYRFAKKRKRSAFLPFLPIATPLSLGLTVMTAIFLPSVRSVTRISLTAAGFRAFFMNVAGSSLYSMISCFLPVIRSRVWMFLSALADGNAYLALVDDEYCSLLDFVDYAVFYAGAADAFK